MQMSQEVNADIGIYSTAFINVYKTVQHALFLTSDSVSTSRLSWGNFIGCQYDSILTLS